MTAWSCDTTPSVGSSEKQRSPPWICRPAVQTTRTTPSIHEGVPPRTLLGPHQPHHDFPRQRHQIRRLHAHASIHTKFRPRIQPLGQLIAYKVTGPETESAETHDLTTHIRHACSIYART